jgi:hypothetical protein
MSDAELAPTPPNDIAQPIVDILARLDDAELRSSDFSAYLGARHALVSQYILGQLVELGVPEADVLLTEPEDDAGEREKLLGKIDGYNFSHWPDEPEITAPPNIGELRRINDVKKLVGVTSTLAVSWIHTKGKTDWYGLPLLYLERYEKSDDYSTVTEYIHSLIYRMKDGDPPLKTPEK